MEKLHRFFIRTLAALLAVNGVLAALLLTLPTAKAAGTPEVIINEVAWAGSTVSTSDEWVELYNTTDSNINLQGWTLTHAATNDGNLVLPASSGSTNTVIPANGYLLISNYGVGSSSDLTVAPDYVTTNVSLSNTCSPIQLLDGSSTLVDQMGCNGSSYFAGSSILPIRTMERVIGEYDGTLSSSWQSSVGFVNMKGTDLSFDYATPKFANDSTAPNTAQAVVDDGSGTDISFTANQTSLSASWTGFTDAQSGVSGYYVGLGSTPTTADVIPFSSSSQTATTTTFTFPAGTLIEGQTYYTVVKAVNTVGLVSGIVASNGVYFSALPPQTPTGLTVIDTPNDNGGSLTASWQPSSSLDTVDYQLNYRKVGEVTWQSIVSNGALSTTVSGLQNQPASYQFTIQAIDFTSLLSAASSIVTAQALDNLAPVINTAKVVVHQNMPGTVDTIEGLAGASSEANATATVFDRNPTDPARMMLGSVQANTDGSFPAISIGDNTHAAVWLQLVDLAGNPSLVDQFANDIVGPNAPTLQMVSSVCKTDSCQIELHWQDNGLDTVRFQVAYVISGIEHRSLDVTGTSLVLSLPTDGLADLSVVAYDGPGNMSARSNVFELGLTKGVTTTITLQNGQPVTIISATPGTREATPVSAKHTTKNALIGSAKAAETTPPANNDQTNSSSNQSGSNSASNSPATSATSNPEWTRILVVAILLLVVATGFYALSRSFTDDENLEPGSPPVKTAPTKEQPKKKPTTRRRSQRRR